MADETYAGTDHELRTTGEARYPLHLASPYMRGDLVRHVQYWMAHNRHDHPFFEIHAKDGHPSGIYDERTASSVHHAKWWLGYPKSHINGRVRNSKFLGYLVPKGHEWYHPLPDLYRKRHHDRLTPPPPGVTALHFAESFVGYGPASCSMFASWYGLPCAAWCAMFESYCFAHTGYPRYRYSYVPNILYDAQLGRNHLVLTHTPKAGDIAIFVWGGAGSNPSGDHTGFVRAVTSSTVESVDGNTGAGEVLRRVRPRSLVRAFVRVLP